MTAHTIAEFSLQGARKRQEDAWGVHQDDTSGRLLAVVADGMGGHTGGDVASAALVAAAEQFWQEGDFTVPPRSVLEALCQAGQARITALAPPDETSPRTTVVALLVQAGEATWCHAGDSRLYHLRGGQVLRRTRDHTMVQTLLDLEEITPEEAARHPARNQITRALGDEEMPRLSFGSAFPEAGDVFLLCTDGVWGRLSEAEIAALSTAPDLEAALAGCVDMAVARGGLHADNATAVVLRISPQNP